MSDGGSEGVTFDRQRHRRNGDANMSVSCDRESRVKMNSVLHRLSKIDYLEFKLRFFQEISEVPDNVGCALSVEPDVGSY